MRILSGIQPSGIPHVGNYFGYIKPNVDLQSSGDVKLMIADLHALTTVQNAVTLRENSMQVALDLLSCGLNPEKSILFYQSSVVEHTELSWILSTIAPMGLLERAVSYKEKVEKGIAATVGLFTYPVLMAADILLYQTTHVPVGKDQKQHLEMTRDIAVKFNSTFGEVFTIPEPVIREEVAVVPGTDGQKMSKSYGNTIPIFCSETEAKKIILGIVTDSKGVNDPKDPETCSIYRIHRLFLSPTEQRELADDYRNGLPYGEAKKRLLSAYLDFFAPMRNKREAYTAKPALVTEVLLDGAKRAQKIAAETMERVRSVTGLA